MQRRSPSKTVKVKSLSCVLLFATPWTVAHQAPQSMGFSRQEYWSGLPLPSPGDLPDLGTEPGSPALRTDALPSDTGSKMVGGVNSPLESNPILTRDAQRAQTNFVCTRTQGPDRDRDRTVFHHLLWKYRSAVVCRRDRGSGCSRPGYGISPLGGGRH